MILEYRQKSGTPEPHWNKMSLRERFIAVMESNGLYASAASAAQVTDEEFQAEQDEADRLPLRKGHYVKVNDPESAAIERHLAYCELCHEDYDVFCDLYWTVGIEPD